MSPPSIPEGGVGLRIAGVIVCLLGLLIVAAVLHRSGAGDTPTWMLLGLGAGGLFFPTLVVAAFLESRSPDGLHRWAGFLPLGMLVLMFTTMGFGALLDRGESKAVGVVMLILAAVVVCAGFLGWRSRVRRAE